MEIEPLPKKLISQKNDSPKKRVVQTEAGEQVKTPPKGSYLGWQNQQVDRQTSGKQTKLEAHHASVKSQSKPNMPSDLKSLSHLGLAMFQVAKEKSVQNPPSQPQQQSPDQTTDASVSSRPEDYIHGIAESDRSALNTKEFVFYSYFQRIRLRLDKAWVPILKERLTAYYRSGRQLASDVEHETRVLVVLNEEGQIIQVQLLSESGVNDLDDSAVDAFNKAGPFPNPPKGIIDGNRQVRIPWDFILKS